MTELKALERLEFVPAAAPAAALGPRGEFKWIALAELGIDPEYQRHVLEAGRKNIRRMIEEFKWALFSPLVVARRGHKRYAIIDGQHRALAAVSHGGFEALPCLVLNCPRAQEALAFATINGMTTAVNPLTIFRARVAAGDERAIEIARACAAAGVTIAAYPKPNKLLAKGETMAIGTLIKCHARFGADVLVEALKTVTKTGDGNTGYLREGVIAGSCDVLSANPAWRGQALLEAVERATIPAMYREALLRKGEAQTTGGSFRAVYGGVLAAKLRFRLTPRAAAVGSSIKPPTLEQRMGRRA